MNRRDEEMKRKLEERGGMPDPAKPCADRNAPQGASGSRAGSRGNSRDSGDAGSAPKDNAGGRWERASHIAERYLNYEGLSPEKMKKYGVFRTGGKIVLLAVKVLLVIAVIGGIVIWILSRLL